LTLKDKIESWKIVLKKFVGILIVAVSLAVAGSGSVAHAASWHRYLPKSLQHTKWQHGYTRLIFGHKWFSLWGPEPGLRWGAGETDVHYKYLGNHRYVIKHKDPQSMWSYNSYLSNLSRTHFTWQWSKGEEKLAYYRY